IRNFGFVTVTGQEQGRVWRLARRSRHIWAEIAGQAGIAIEQKGLLIIAQRPEAEAVLHAFLRTDRAEGCAWLGRAEAEALIGPMRPGQLCGALTSDIDIRVESRTAIPTLARWLEESSVAVRRGV